MGCKDRTSYACCFDALFFFCVKSVHVNSSLFHVAGTATRDNVGRQVESLPRFSVGYNPKFLCSGVKLFRPLKFWKITMFLTIFGE